MIPKDEQAYRLATQRRREIMLQRALQKAEGQAARRFFFNVLITWGAIVSAIAGILVIFAKTLTFYN